MVQINWTPNSLLDLKGIADYIKKDSQRYARITVERIKNSTEVLLNLPNSGGIVPEFNRSDLRQLIEGNYRIIYKIVDNNRVDILTIHHSSRDLIGRKIQI